MFLGMLPPAGAKEMGRDSRPGLLGRNPVG